MESRPRKRRRRETVTLTHVAEAVGVSPRTVSRVVNGQGGCSDDTRRRIEEAISSLGYRPNMMARGLLTNRSNTIGMIGPEFAAPFFTEVADSVQRHARAWGRTMFFAGTDDDPVQQSSVLSTFEGYGVDGVVVFPTAWSFDSIIATAEAGLPIVVINHDVVARNLACVTCDLRQGARMAVDHLLSTGRRRIAMATTAATLRFQDHPRRQQGYYDALEAAGLEIDPTLLASSVNTVEGGRLAAEQLLALPEPPDAVFAYNDMMAIGLMQELIRRGVRVPDDIAVVGFDDVLVARAAVPTLTTVRIPRDELGRQAVASLRRLTEGDGTVETIVLPTELVVRESA